MEGDFWNDPIHRICRKERPCIWCGEKISKGSNYMVQSGKFYGEFQTNHWHPECFEYFGENDEDGEFIPFDNPRGEQV